MIKPRAVHEDVCRWATVGQDVGEHHLFCAEGNAPSTGDGFITSLWAHSLLRTDIVKVFAGRRELVIPGARFYLGRFDLNRWIATKRQLFKIVVCRVEGAAVDSIVGYDGVIETEMEDGL